MPSQTAPPTINRTFRRINSIDVDMFMSDLSSELLITQAPSTLSDLIELYNSTLSCLLDKHAPLITKPLSSRPSNPWFTPYLHELKATRRHIEKAWKRSSDSYHAMRLRVITNFYHHSIIKAKKIYHASLIAANKLQQKNGSGKRSIPFYITNLQIFFLLLLLHPLWQINLHLSSQIKSPNSTLLSHQQLTPHHHTLNHLLYHLNLPLSAL